MLNNDSTCNTSSKFTYSAREAAEQENIELIDGDKLLNEME